MFELKEKVYIMSEYKDNYNKEKYTPCNLRVKPEIARIIDEYAANMSVSKAALIQKCVLYCYNEMIDVSGVKLSTPEK